MASPSPAHVHRAVHRVFVWRLTGSAHHNATARYNDPEEDLNIGDLEALLEQAHCSLVHPCALALAALSLQLCLHCHCPRPCNGPTVRRGRRRRSRWRVGSTSPSASPSASDARRALHNRGTRDGCESGRLRGRARRVERRRGRAGPTGRGCVRWRSSKRVACDHTSHTAHCFVCAGTRRCACAS